MIERLIASSPYLGLFVALLLGSLGAPIPEEIPIVTAGVMAHEQVVHWWLALAVCVVGVLSGDLVLYGAGRRWGARVLERPLVRCLLDPARQQELAARYRRHGVLIVFAARHVMGLRAAAFVTAGIVRLPFWKFLAADGVAIGYGVPLNFGIAYLFAERLQALVTEVHRAERWLAVAVLVAGAGWLYYELRRRGHRALRPAGGTSGPPPPGPDGSLSPR